MPKTCKMSNIQVDGRILKMAQDPPGQNSAYIPPVERNREVHRLTAFARFPRFAPVNPCALARNGFYFTGYRDRVKCFSCGQSVDSWVVGDDPMLLRWHVSDCPFARGNDTENVPIERFHHANHVETSSQPQARMSNTPQSEVATSSRETPIQRSRDFDVATEAAHYETLFTCTDPVNPHMREENRRLQTFVGNMRNWPSHRIATTPKQMVEAGLYYLGERDRVRCWYCNGGLRNWDTNDDPWFEHAKWFPSCEFLLQKKGPAYVHNVVAQFPNLNRPTPVNAASALDLPPTVTSGLSPSRSNMPIIVDPREEVRKRERKVDEEIQKSPLVAGAKMMGFTEMQVRFAMLRRLEESGHIHSSLEHLVDCILSNPDLIPEDHENAGSSANVDEESSEGVQNTINELNRLQTSRSCRICRTSQANIVLLPCGHIACCEGCSKGLNRCPICKSFVRETLKSYIA